MLYVSPLVFLQLQFITHGLMHANMMLQLLQSFVSCHLFMWVSSTSTVQPSFHWELLSSLFVIWHCGTTENLILWYFNDIYFIIISTPYRKSIIPLSWSHQIVVHPPCIQLLSYCHSTESHNIAIHLPCSISTQPQCMFPIV